MIESYSDHAASERTFLAWVRTGIAGIQAALMAVPGEIRKMIAHLSHGTARPVDGPSSESVYEVSKASGYLAIRRSLGELDLRSASRSILANG
jgi:uncharacterized membrane protein YidH (DUF202 family)